MELLRNSDGLEISKCTGHAGFSLLYVTVTILAHVTLVGPRNFDDNVLHPSLSHSLNLYIDIYTCIHTHIYIYIYTYTYPSIVEPIYIHVYILEQVSTCLLSVFIKFLICYIYTLFEMICFLQRILGMHMTHLIHVTSFR